MSHLEQEYDDFDIYETFVSKQMKIKERKKAINLPKYTFKNRHFQFICIDERPLCHLFLHVFSRDTFT